MSAKIWLMVGLARGFRGSARSSSANDHSTDDTRGRVAVTTDGDAGLWWLPVADTNGKKKHRGSVRAQLVQHAARPDERRQLHGERLVWPDRAVGRLRCVGLHSARRPRQPAVVQHRPGTRRRRSPRAVRERTLDRQQDRRPARRRQVRAPERRRPAIPSASLPAASSTCRPAMPTKAPARAACPPTSAASSASGSTATSC